MVHAYNVLENSKHPRSELDVLSCLRKGLPAKSVGKLSESLLITREAVCKLLGLSFRTINRRDKLKIDEADKLYRLARIFALAVQVLENKQQAIQWLNTPKLALNNELPLALLNTELGAREVEKLLNRIEYGVYS
jgi:putative toxin-antitoxin system antitoxin component (TIGR02293 family)